MYGMRPTCPVGTPRRGALALTPTNLLCSIATQQQNTPCCDESATPATPLFHTSEGSASPARAMQYADGRPSGPSAQAPLRIPTQRTSPQISDGASESGSSSQLQSVYSV